jgi:hypothetical protein
MEFLLYPLSILLKKEWLAHYFPHGLSHLSFLISPFLYDLPRNHKLPLRICPFVSKHWGRRV